MTIIIPMTGMGRRFIEAAYAEPKPLISIDGMPMIEHVVRMFPQSADFLFICNTQHLQETNLGDVLSRIAPQGKIFPLEKKVWDGPVPDVLAAARDVPDDAPALVCYCDFTVEWDAARFEKTAADFDGAIVAYRGFHPHHLGPTYYGYMRVNEKNELLEIQEKKPFTNNRMGEFAAAGSYYFRSGELMKKYFREAVEKNMRTGSEFYASLPFNLMARDGLKILVYEVPRFIQFGTPEDVQSYEYWLGYFRSKKML